jgi:hypothetical protein
MMVVTIFLAAGDIFDAAFLEDRKRMVPGVDFSKAPLLMPAKLLQLRANMELLDRQLCDGRAFLLGDSPSLADFSAYHPHAFLQRHATTRRLLDGLDALASWLERVAAIGHGTRTELDAKDAIEIARAARPAPLAIPGPPLEVPGLAPGAAVVVLPEEPGSGSVAGELLASSVHEIAIRRRSERAGELVVHFPREDYLVVRAR